MFQRLTTAMIVLLFAAGGLFSAASAAEGDEQGPGTTWSLQPASEGSVDGRVSLRHRMDPGAKVQEQLSLTNFSAAPASFAVYASDGIVSDSGSFDLRPTDELAEDGGSWISLGDVTGAKRREDGGLTLEVAAGASVMIPVSIDVPAQATPGDHPAGIVAELLATTGSEVQISTRVGVRAHLRVTGDIVASLKAHTADAGYDMSWNPFAPGTTHIDVDIENTGNVRLAASGTVTVTGPFGIFPVTAPLTDGREVLPGQSARASIELPAWPLLLAFGEVEIAPQAIGEDEIETPLTTSPASFAVWTVPWSQLTGIALVALAFWLIRRQRSRSAARVQERIDAAVAAATSEAAAHHEPPTSEISDASDTAGAAVSVEPDQAWFSASAARPGKPVDSRRAMRNSGFTVRGGRR